MRIYLTFSQDFPGSSSSGEFSEAISDLRNCLANSVTGYDEFILSLAGRESKMRVAEIATLDLSQLSEIGSVLIEIIAPNSHKLIRTLKFDSVEIEEADLHIAH